jgi:hypothetical protein
MLVAEAETMVDCVECHEPEDFHTCETCHDDHGSAEMSGVPFNDLVLFSGDVPLSGYIPVNEILPYRDQPGTHMALQDLLAERGVESFESVTLASRDGGFVTFAQDALTDEALVLPHVDGMRFAAENLHVSTWLKGISRIIVVAEEKPLSIDGHRTSIGRLMLGPTHTTTIEQTEVMLKSEADGQIRKGKTASRIEGAPIEILVDDPKFRELLVVDADGAHHTLTVEEARGAILTQLRGRPEVVLVLPERGRAAWIANVVEIQSQ